MTTESATKKCPFCAEEIKAAAIKCRFCGEMLDGSAPRARAAAQPTYETRAFVIPFPEGSPPTQYVFDFKNDKPFPDDYLRAIGMFNKKTWDFLRRSFRGGVTLTWDAYKDYFLERINELGKEGWELTEPFEHPVDEHGWLVRANDRFEFEGAQGQGVFGPVKRTRFAGAKFIMRRMTFGGSQAHANGDAGRVTWETKVVEIPFPEGSAPRTSPMRSLSDVPFTNLWIAWRDYFRSQLEELRAQGWELAEPFELGNPESRFVLEHVAGNGPSDEHAPFLFAAALTATWTCPPGPASDEHAPFLFAAARFRMRRIALTSGESAD